MCFWVFGVFMLMAVIAIVISLVSRSAKNRKYSARIQSRTKNASSTHEPDKVYKICPYCKSEVDAAARFCPGCGAPFEDQ